jgi:hypothetical protein
VIIFQKGLLSTTIVINSEPKLKGDLVRFTANAKQAVNNGKTEKVSGLVLTSIKDKLAKKLFYGEELLIPAKYAFIDPPFNPGEFNYKSYLANHNIHYQSFTDNNFKYAIQPGLDSNRITDYKVYSLDNNIRCAYLIKQGGLMQFLNKRLVMLNHGAAITSIPQRLQIIYLYITNNTYADTAIISKSNMLIIDGSNTDKHITKLSEAANKLKVNYTILRRNKSFTAISN